MKTPLFLLLLVAITFHLSAQNTLIRSCNTPRAGDHLVKQQIDYKAPGDKGIGIVWDFSDHKEVNNPYELKYRSLNNSSDTLVGTEHRTMYYYHLRGDTLFSLGDENPTTLINYREWETLLTFPFAYGRTLTDYFDGTGIYCNRLSIHVQGKSVVTADATGDIILPGGDTLQHVLRVYTRKQITEQMNSITPDTPLRTDTLAFVLNRDSIDWHLANDSSATQIDTWRWYAAGYRYPVFESIESYICKSGTKYPYFTTSFYYPPHEQYYALNEDTDNQVKRDELRKKEYTISGEGKTSSGGKYSDDKLSYRISINSQGILCIDYTLYEQADVMMGLYDLQGRQLSNLTELQCPEGSYTQTLSLNEFPDGEYLLHLTINGKTYAEKLWKR